jgi:hypothetical protein
MTWNREDTEFLIQNYPSKGMKYCAIKLNKSIPSIRMKTSRLGLYQNRDSDFFKNWQSRAAKSKIGKKRPNQALVLKRVHEQGKLVKTEEQKKSIGIRSKKWIKENGHPKGMLGKKHSDEFKEMQSIRSKETWFNMDDEKKLMRNRKIIETRIKNQCYAPQRTSCTWKSGWREIGLIKKYYRSKWEANYARYLEWLKSIGEIKEWLHEPDVFWFEGIRRGCVSYLPDFKVVNNNDSIEYHEVKGWMDDRSKTKISRMKKYHPDIKLIVIREKEYNQIKLKISKLIKGWE